ncbi:O-succinylhomoserine sulfhydrylase [Streptomyces violarus]
MSESAAGDAHGVTGGAGPATGAAGRAGREIAPVAAGAGDGTRAVRAGLPEPAKYEPTLPGPVFAAHYHLPGEPTGPYTYGRDENPTWTLLERAVGELEAPGQGGAETLVFASGMAAISAVLFSQLRAGDVCVLPDDGYQALPLVRAQLEAYGIEVRTAPPVVTPSSTSSTARSCCGSRPRRTPASTCATSGGSRRRRTRVAPWWPSTSPSTSSRAPR